MRSALRGALGLAVLLAAGPAAASAEAPGLLELAVEDARTARVLHREAVRLGSDVTLEYVHSSEGVRVRGVVRVEADGSLSVVETAFAGFGPGLPELVPGDHWRIEDGMIVHRPFPLPLEELRVRVGPFTRHRLRTPAGTQLDLSALMGPGGTVLVHVR